MHIADLSFLTFELILGLQVLLLGWIGLLLRKLIDIVVKLISLESAYVLVQVLVLGQLHSR